MLRRRHVTDGAEPCPEEKVNFSPSTQKINLSPRSPRIISRKARHARKVEDSLKVNRRLAESESKRLAEGE